MHPGGGVRHTSSMLIRLLRLILIFILVSVVASFVRAVFQGLSGRPGSADGQRHAGGDGHRGHTGAGGSRTSYGHRPGDRRKQALKTLGLEDGASDREIRRAYRELAQKYHPDRVAHLGPELVELTSEKFREVREAYEFLEGTA